MSDDVGIEIGGAMEVPTMDEKSRKCMRAHFAKRLIDKNVQIK